MVVCQRVFNLNEIATWFDRLTMSGCAPRNDWGLRISPSPQPSPIKGEGAFDKLGMILRQAQDERALFAMTTERPCRCCLSSYLSIAGVLRYPNDCTEQLQIDPKPGITGGSSYERTNCSRQRVRQTL